MSWKSGYHKTSICTYKIGFLYGCSHKVQRNNQDVPESQVIKPSFEEESLPTSNNQFSPTRPLNC